MEISTYSFDLVDSKGYVISENRSLIIIDPCLSPEEVGEIRRRGDFDEVKVLLTHEHYDHIFGIDSIRQHWDDCSVICSSGCAQNIKSPLRNGSNHFSALLMDKDEELYRRAQLIEPVSFEADMVFTDGFAFDWEGHEVRMVLTPGHSKGSCCVVIDDKYLFTGDSLLRDAPVITRLPGGSKAMYSSETIPFFLSLDPGMDVYPGHGEGDTLGNMLIKNGIT
ncbi:MAG: MBL fold metallo-hydrolase [Bacillota bacterium]